MMNNSQGASSFFSGLSTLLGRPHSLLHNLSDTTGVLGATWYWDAFSTVNEFLGDATIAQVNNPWVLAAAQNCTDVAAQNCTLDDFVAARRGA